MDMMKRKILPVLTALALCAALLAGCGGSASSQDAASEAAGGAPSAAGGQDRVSRPSPRAAWTSSFRSAWAGSSSSYSPSRPGAASFILAISWRDASMVAPLPDR